MKKKIICSVAFLAAIIGASATVEWTGDCGETVITVGIEYFENNPIAVDEYYRELNEIFCGNRNGGYTIRRGDI
jgi:hypothetical protein